MFTSAQLAEVEAAILALATGARVATVGFGERTISYVPTDLDKLKALRREIIAELATSTTTVRQVRVYSDKGL